ncbi:hypothetical protein QLQ12_39605 [Actinoplanes sp. NEAU-A12]|uniref:Uncharacterized protein n=1 Tax=Actinoplanes sandaracinus TaxID=3045177 RepID=A0ABT6WY80_9ACTN|nr:hypothetical protein [Actinoplanes sandaracinus]MDI6104715.1 hypothetical protein [Actinoplanes sandaracinus]
MGSRVNVAVRQGGDWTHCGSNGLGYSLGAYLALGPGPALAVVRSRSLPVWDRRQWQLESTCEGAALIDLDARDLLFFLDLGYEQRLAVLEAYGRTWAGWTVRWAYNGLADVTDALGVSRDVLQRDPWDGTDLFRWHRPGPDEELVLRQMITVGEVAYGLDHHAVDPWEIGPALLDQIGDLPRVTTLPEMPRAGLHLDPVARTAGVWSVAPVRNLTERFAGRWPGWTLEFWEDRYREHASRCAGVFEFPDPAVAVEESVHDLVENVLHHWLRAMPEFRQRWPAKEEADYDPYYGTRDAGLTIADLQRLCGALLGPDRDPVDVAARARKELRIT